MFLSILSCNYGGGHRRVAETIAAEWRDRTGGDVEVVDYFRRFAGPFFEWATRTGYYQTIRFAPGLQGRFYAFMGTIRPDAPFRRGVNRTGKTRLARYLAARRPDAVCCVHWTFAGTMSELRGAGRTTVPCLTVITDYTGHGQWLHPHVDRYCVAHAAIRDEMERRGIRADRIAVTGVPVERKFAVSMDRHAAAARLGLRPGVPVVLVMAGAYAALGGIDDLVGVLARFPRPVQPVVVCANAPRLLRRVRAAAAQSPLVFRVLPYVDNVDEWMAASDVLLTKAGGVTIGEALVRRLPMLLYGSIPGHEEANARFAVDRGAAVAAATPREAGALLGRLLAAPERLEAMRRAAQVLARPDAAAAVVDQLQALARGAAARTPTLSVAASDA